MLYFQVTSAALFCVSAFAAAYAALSILGRRDPRVARRARGSDLFDDTLVFLVRGGLLIDANFAARRLLAHFGSGELEKGALMRALHANFENADELVDAGNHDTSMRAVSRDGCIQGVAETTDGTTRIKLSSRMQPNPVSADLHLLSAQEAELKTLRETSEMAPYLVWREAPDGTPIWVNRAYHSLVQQAFGGERAAKWPLPRLFESAQHGAPTRVSLKIPSDGNPQWFECH